MVGVMFPIAFIFLLLFCDFYDCLLFAFAFMPLDSSLNNQESILTCLLSFSLIIRLYHYIMVLLHYIIIYYITKSHYSRLFYLIMLFLFI